MQKIIHQKNPALPNNVLRALKEFYEAVDQNNVPWVLCGSTSLFIQGVDVIISNDIDILTNKEGSEKICALLEKSGIMRVRKLELSSTKKYRSYFAIYEINGITIDVMGEFQHKLKNGEWSIPAKIDKFFIKNFQKMSLPILPLEFELEEYQNLGREDKVNKIKSFIQEKSK